MPEDYGRTPDRPRAERSHGRWNLPVIVEDVLIVLAIPVLWLTVFRLHGRIYDLIQGVTLGAMVVILIRRINRFRNPPPSGDEGSPTVF